MIGEWEVDGVFRTPDHIHTDRTLWYLTRDGGITRFDGQTWTTYAHGQSELADSIRQTIDGPAEPYPFTNERNVTRIQDGFALLIDEGRTSGSMMVFFTRPLTPGWQTIFTPRLTAYPHRWQKRAKVCPSSKVTGRIAGVSGSFVEGMKYTGLIITLFGPISHSMRARRGSTIRSCSRSGAIDPMD